MIAGIERDYFLFGLAFIWIVIAVVQDFKKREVSDWLNFSLIAFALAYRTFFSAYSSDFWFFAYGVIGFALFFGLANLFYYLRVFAGGDAKLLMGIGAVLPFSNWLDLIFVGISFVFLLFFFGAIYSLIYSIFLVRANYNKFSFKFKENLQDKKNWALVVIASFLISIIFYLISANLIIALFVLLFSIFVFLLIIYTKCLEICMMKLVSPKKLTEGDWIISDIKLNNYIVRKTAHGLNAEDIARLKRAGRKVLIREGIPFTPAFLIAFLFMVFFSAILGFDLNLFLRALFLS